MSFTKHLALDSLPLVISAEAEIQVPVSPTDARGHDDPEVYTILGEVLKLGLNNVVVGLLFSRPEMGGNAIGGKLPFHVADIPSQT